MDLLGQYDYPGNVRELENAVERACALCDDDMIMATDLPPQIVDFNKEEAPARRRTGCPSASRSTNSSSSRSASISKRRSRNIKASREKAASVLGISMATLYRKLELKGKK